MFWFGDNTDKDSGQHDRQQNQPGERDDAHTQSHAYTRARARAEVSEDWESSDPDTDGVDTEVDAEVEVEDTTGRVEMHIGRVTGDLILQGQAGGTWIRLENPEEHALEVER